LESRPREAASRFEKATGTLGPVSLTFRQNLVLNCYSKRDVEGKTTALTNLREEVNRLSEVVQEEEQGKLGLEEEIASIGESIARIRNEGEREQRRKDRCVVPVGCDDCFSSMPLRSGWTKI
jgi:hypothetical protein